MPANRPAQRSVPSDRHRQGASRAHLMLPLAGAGLIISCVAALMLSPSETFPVSYVIRTIREIALSADQPDAPAEAGLLGPWRIKAASVDPVSGRFNDFHVQCGQMLIAAKTAHVTVDPAADTFSIEMWEVVFLRVPDEDTDPAAGVHMVEHHVLGPAPYGADIVADGTSAYDPPRGGDRGDDLSPLTVADDAMKGE